MGSIGHPSMSKAELVPYLHLIQGHGGIYTLPFCQHGGVDVERIGTHSCWTCVCVYVRLDEKRCFVAHIDGHTHAIIEGLDWIPEGPEQGASLEAYVKDLIREDLPEPFKNKSPSEKEEVQRSIVIVCPRENMVHPEISKEVRATGHYIVKAIRSYFEIDQPAKPDEPAHGFIVNHRTQELVKLQWDTDVQPTAAYLTEVGIASAKPAGKQTAKDLALIKQYPQTLSPESQGFCEVPGRPWTLVYDYGFHDWRKMKLSDFNPFMPCSKNPKQDAEDQDDTSNSPDGDASGLSTASPQHQTKQDYGRSGNQGLDFSQQGYDSIQVLTVVAAMVSAVASITNVIRHWQD